MAAALASPASFLLGCVATFSPLTGSPMAQASDHRLLTSPRIFLVGMAAFLILVGFVALDPLQADRCSRFRANPGLNGLIIGVLTIGSLFAFRQVFRLFREIRWVNSLVRAGRRRANRRAADCSGRWRR